MTAETRRRHNELLVNNLYTAPSTNIVTDYLLETLNEVRTSVLTFEFNLQTFPIRISDYRVTTIEKWRHFVYLGDKLIICRI